MTRPSLQQVGWLVGPAALLLGAVLLNQPHTPPRPAQSVTGPVAVTAAALRVIDGDTVEFQGLNYRLTGYDTPEVRNAACEIEKALGNRATARLQAMIDAASSMELRVKAGRDRYGRGLGSLLVDGQDVGDVLIAESLARRYHGGQRSGWC
ncbi:hypothetical protein OCH239_17440 [Roseivivax halodurans JCM 10272]|uniref:TNase-like domain-containing protein n=1 Tax=Roseivivax halodurans JCM 10272 TaxID=1449350 RepID=X7EA32_9RHOB|nr:hypothetical protein OCH239_17440 [Roseivivax halodurans JCM 10272]